MHNDDTYWKAVNSLLENSPYISDLTKKNIIIGDPKSHKISRNYLTRKIQAVHLKKGRNVFLSKK